MTQNSKNIRIIGCILLVIGLFLPMISINILSMSKGISLFDLVTNIQSLNFLGNLNNIISLVYGIFIVYLAAIIISGLAIFNNSRKFTLISGILAMAYSIFIFFGVQYAKSQLASTAKDPFSNAIGAAAASMFNVDIGVGAAFFASLLLLGSLMMKENS